MKVIFPFGGVSARGAFAGRLIFQNRRGKNVAYFKKPKKLTRSNAQTVTRHDYSTCIEEWRITRLEEWDKWTTLAEKKGLTGICLFMQWWIQDLYNAISGVGICGGCISGAVNHDPNKSPDYMINYRKLVYGK